MMRLETYITDLIEGRKRAPFICGALRVISGIFRAGVTLRNFAFDRRLIREMRVPIPVVSVGNITAGGTGKTPLIQKLGRDLSTTKRVSILLRGYRSAIEKGKGSLHVVQNSRMTPQMCGDEAYLLWKLMPHVTLFVGRDRCSNAQKAVDHEADVILLDDGMQYRRLHRTFELVMLHADDLYGKGFYLPRGYLRDSPKRLARADYLFINHVRDRGHFDALKEKLKEKVAAPLIGVQMVPHAIRGKDGTVWENIRGRRVAVFCGLGKPSSFLKTLEKMGLDIALSLLLPDHISPAEEELVKFVSLAESKGCELILCSEKDWVKLPKSLDFPLPLAYLEASLEILSGQGHYDELLGRIIAHAKIAR